jgi:hypothetical protein
MMTAFAGQPIAPTPKVIPAAMPAAALIEFEESVVTVSEDNMPKHFTLLLRAEGL